MKFFKKEPNIFIKNYSYLIINNTLATSQILYLIECSNRFDYNHPRVKYIQKLKIGRTVTSRLLNHIMRSGLKKKFLKILTKAIYYFYLTLPDILKSLKASEALTLDQTISIIKEDNNFFDFCSILEFFCKMLEPIFYTRIEKINKKINKKIKKRYSTKTVYIKPKLRMATVLKSLSNYSNFFEDYSIQRRLMQSFLLTFVQNKNSVLYKRKLTMYNLFLKTINKDSI